MVFSKFSKSKTVTFYACSVGFAITVGTTYSILALQSSINVKNSLGTTSLMLMFIFGIISGIFVCPIILKRIGAKRSLIAGESSYMMFTIANIYPTWYTMYAASFISGIGMLSWSASGLIIHSIASGESENNRENKDSVAQHYFGRYLAIVSLGQVFSNGVSGLILNIGKTKHDDMVSNTSLIFPDMNSTFNNSDSLLTCGSQDCPSHYAFLESSTKFAVLIPSQMSICLLLATFGLMQFCAILSHCLLLENIPEEYTETQETNRLITESGATNNAEATTAYHDFLASIKSLVQHVTSPQVALTSPVYLLLGVVSSFLWTEFGRSYVSCVIGVEQVGICTMLIDILSFVTSIIISASAKRFGLVTLFVTAFAYDLVNLLCALIWVPTISTSYYIPFIFSVTFGVTHGLRRNIVYLVTEAYCEDKKSGYSWQVVVESLGASINFAWSTPLCVYVKIYIIMILTVTTTVMGFAAESLRRRKY